MDKGLLFFVSLALVVSLIVAAGFAIIVNTGAQTEANFEAITANESDLQGAETMLRVLLAVTGCTEKDTPKECKTRQENRGLKEGRRRIKEVDCRIRRALRKLPPPKFGHPCTYGRR